MAFGASLASFAWASSALASALFPGGNHHPDGQPGHTVDAAKPVASSSADPQPELLLMDVMYDQLRVDSALSVLQDKQGRRYVPVRQFASTLGFRLHIDTDRRMVEGFLNSPSQRLELDAAKGIYRLTKSTNRFDPALAFVKDGDLYLEADLFARISGLHLLWQMNLLQLEVSSTSPLNVEKQWIQRARQDVDQMSAMAQQTYRSVSVPYKLWSVPAIDAQIFTSGAVSDNTAQNGTSVSVTGAGDLLMMSAQYRVMSDSNGQSTALLSLGRSDPGAQLLGGLHATQFSFGDLYLPPEPLLARGRNAMGVTLSNAPLAGAGQKDFGQLRGHGVPGAQVELYEHDQLLGTAQSDSDGNYHFFGLNLDRGPNDLKVVNITPDGDVHESSRRVYSGNDGPALDETRYTLTAGRVGSSVFGADTFGTVQNQDTTEFIADFQKGLGNGTWASAVSALTQGQQGFEKEIGLGLHSWVGPMLWNAQSMVSLDGGTAFSTGVTEKIGKVYATLERTQASGSMAARILPEIGANGTSLTSLDLSGVSGKRGQAMSYGFQVDRLEGAAPATIARARLSEGNLDFMVSNSFTLRLTDSPTELSGYTEIRKSLGQSVGLLDVSYNLAGGSALQLARLTLNRRIDSNFSARTGLEYDLTRSQPLGVLATIYHAFGPVDLGLNLEVLQGGIVHANLLFSTGLQGESPQGSMALARPGVGESGSVVVRAFVDKDQSGKYKPGDPLLPEVGFLIDGHPRSVVTGKDGKATIDHLSPNQRVNISADENSFENPSWVSENPGVSTVPRPGRVIAIDFPVLETAELEGKFIQPKGVAPPPGLSAQLIDSKQQVSDTSILDSAGTYVFSRVRPGTYHIRLVDLGGKTIAQRELSVTPGEVIRNADIDLSPRIP